MRLIDTHNHLGCDGFESDRNQIIEHCVELGVIRQIMVGVFAEEWLTYIQLALKHPSLYVACGIHPLFLPDTPASVNHSLTTLSQLLSQSQYTPKFCAIGEIGLDYYVEHSDKNQQLLIFLQQLELATQYQRPILLHIRRAHSDAIKLLKESHFKQRGIVHAFSGSYEEAKEYIKLGFKIGLGGSGTYPQAYRMHRVLQQLPLDAIVLETDAPDLSPVSQQGKRNSPEYLPQICQLLANIKGIDAEKLAQQTTDNCCELFNWSL